MHNSTTLFTFAFCLFTFAVSLAQESKISKIDTIQTTNSTIPNAPQVEQGDVKITDGNNTLIRITDEGTFGAIEIKTGVPSTSTDKLYNDGGTLKFNGSALGSGSGATEIDDLSDAQYIGRSIFLGEGSGLNDDGTTNNNTSVGFNSLKSNTSGHENTAFGNYSLTNNNIGFWNTAIGYSAMSSKISGISNTALGMNALGLNSAGSGNIVIGHWAGYNELGSNKLYINNDSSSSPLIWGDFTYGSKQVKINGDFHVTGNVTGVEINDLTDAKYDGSSLSLGVDAGRDDDGTTNANTAIGFRSLRDNTSGSNNTAIGNSALLNNETGGSNTAIGKSALWLNTSGISNVAIGGRALESNTIRGSNTAIGVWSLRDADANNNTAIGYHALYQTTTGFSNTALGVSTLSSNTIGRFNVGLGSGANQLNVEGDYNTAVGFQAGYGSNGISTSRNIFLGYRAGYNETSDDKLYIENSNSSSPLIWGDFANDIVAINGKFGVGTQSPNAKVTIVAASSGEVPLRIKIGGGTKFKVEENGGVAIGINSSSTPANGLYVNGDILYNGAHTHTSDRRFKTNIKPIENAINRIKNIRGVYFDWNRTKFPQKDFTDKHQIGVIAQEVEKEFPELVRTGEDGYKSVDYSKLAPILIEAVKEQDERIKKLEEENENLKKQFVKNTNLENKVELLEHALNKIIREQQQIRVSKN